MNKRDITPIEGFFLTSKDNLIFDVKGTSQPKDSIIAFVRYVPTALYPLADKTSYKDYVKIYELKERYNFLEDYFPYYLYPDPKGRGLLQAVSNELIQEIHNPINKLQDLYQRSYTSLDSMQQNLVELCNQLEEYSSISIDNLGVSGSLLVDLHRKNSDIDLVVYGKEQGLKLYQTMQEIFNKCFKINQYSKSELKNLWETRGQEDQIDFESFYDMERHKLLQGTIGTTDFYIRLILPQQDYYEPYDTTEITDLGIIEIEAEIANDEQSIFTPCIYDLKNVQVLNQTETSNITPERIYSVRGRYCELAKIGDKIRSRGKFELMKIDNKVIGQVVLGTIENEYLKII
ncbi:MAG: hypothetical protein FK734_05220 [Asgard group archaeon]|nr:hypothetical protein [Asgard group archaeon]